MRTYLFDDRDSLIHALLGFLFALIPVLGVIGWPLFIYYEWQEPEDPVATIGDVWEAGIGYIEGLLIVHAFHLTPLITTSL